MANIQIRPAARQSAKPLVGLYSESGAGKTYSALLLGRGYVGPKGRILMIETESGRGESYADPREYPELAGDGQATNYDVISLREDFSPKAYGEAISVAEAAKVDALLIDSASHEWEGIGGVLSMAAENESKGIKGVLVWQKPKIAHKREFMLRFMQTPIPLVILCMRAKYPMEQKLKDGRKDWVRSESLDPIQSEDILFEMFLHGWIDRTAHAFHITKNTARSLETVFEKDKPISLETGRRFAAWARGEDVGKPTASLQTPANDPKAEAAAKAQAVKKALLDAAGAGLAALNDEWEKLAPKQQEYLQPYWDSDLFPAAKAFDDAKANQEPWS